MKKTLSNRWCMVRITDAGEVHFWMDTLDVAKTLCVRKAADILSIDGDTPADYPEWQPRKCTVTIELEE